MGAVGQQHFTLNYCTFSPDGVPNEQLCPTRHALFFKHPNGECLRHFTKDPSFKQQSNHNGNLLLYVSSCVILRHVAKETQVLKNPLISKDLSQVLFLLAREVTSASAPMKPCSREHPPPRVVLPLRPLIYRRQQGDDGPACPPR